MDAFGKLFTYSFSIDDQIKVNQQTEANYWSGKTNKKSKIDANPSLKTIKENYEEQLQAEAKKSQLQSNSIT